MPSINLSNIKSKKSGECLESIPGWLGEKQACCVAQLVECPSKISVLCNSTGVMLFESRFSKTNCLSDNSSFFATALTCEGTTEGETSHSLITWRTAKLSLIDGNLSRLVLGAITKPAA